MRSALADARNRIFIGFVAAGRCRARAGACTHGIDPSAGTYDSTSHNHNQRARDHGVEPAAFTRRDGEDRQEPMNRFVILSGCSGGGKSTLLAALAARGYATVAEPGRRIVAEETAHGGTALPWLDLAAFARRAMEMAIEDRQRAAALPGLVVFDRGLIDAAVALHHATGEDVLSPLLTEHRYDRTVFLTPPWAEIFHGDDARRHGWAEAVAEYERLVEAYATLGYEAAILPRASVAGRVGFVLERLRRSASDAEKYSRKSIA